MIINGNALHIPLKDKSVDAIITDPPYGLTQNKKGGSGETSLNLASPAGRARVTTGGGFMGQKWDATVPGVEYWIDALRVCKPGAYLLAFGGTRTHHRLMCAIEDAGWELRDTLMWLYGQGFPKSLDVGKAIDKAADANRQVINEAKPVKRMIPGSDQNKTGSWIKDNGRWFIQTVTAPATAAAQQWDGWGTALKPAWEPIILARKPLDGTVAQNVQKWGTGAINIDACRVDGPKGNGVWGTNQPKHLGTFNKSPGNPNYKTEHNEGGRWPANVILDDESAAMLDAQTGELVSGKPAGVKAGGKLNVYSQFAGELPVTGFGDRGGASRFFYTSKASPSDREAGNNHPTVKPQNLIKWLINLITRPGAIILDPFAGSGTVGKVALNLGRRAVLLELSGEYIELIKRRLSHVNLGLELGA